MLCTTPYYTEQMSRDDDVLVYVENGSAHSTKSGVERPDVVVVCTETLTVLWYRHRAVLDIHIISIYLLWFIARDDLLEVLQIIRVDRIVIWRGVRVAVLEICPLRMDKTFLCSQNPGW